MAQTNKLHRYARQIADKLSRGKPPPLTAELAAYLEDRPERLLESLAGFTQNLGTDGETGDALAAAYLLLMRMQFEFLRYGIDRNLEWARELQDRFEKRAASLARSGDLPATALGMVTGAMHEARLPPGPEMLTVSREMLDAETVDAIGPVEVGPLLEQIAEEIGDDAFALADAMGQATHAMPTELRSALAGQMAASDSATLTEAAVLFVLEPEKVVRRGTATALQESAATLTPTALRRLIAIRNWLPEDERPAVDQVIRAARTSGVDCARWEPGRTVEIRASTIDGSGAQGLLIVSPAGKRHRLSSILLRPEVGILDAWSTEPSSRREISQMFDEASVTGPLLSVSQSYLDQAIGHCLAVGLENEAVPPAGLLQIAETIEATDWRPAKLNWTDALETLLAELPAPLLLPASVEGMLEASAAWAAAEGVSDSWFEDDEEVHEVLGETPLRHVDERLVQRVLSEIIEPRRLKWTERFLWLALWLKEGLKGAEAELDPPWPMFAVLTRELARGRPIETIPLMQVIAVNTIMGTEE